MKKQITSKWIMLILSILPFRAFCELQRLSILPQSEIKITKYTDGSLLSLCIDYFRDAPDVYSQGNFPKYNQVYSTGQTEIKVNGKIVDKNFQQLVSGDTPMLLLEPNSYQDVTLKINPNYPGFKDIQSVNIRVKSHFEIGNIKEDRDVSQSDIIFKNFGQDISQTEFWKYSECMDILKKNNQLLSAENGVIAPASMTRINNLLNQFDLSFFDQKTLKNLIDNGIIKTNETGQVSKESLQYLEQVAFYINSIKTTKELNKVWVEYSNNQNPAIKELLYNSNTHLTDIEKNNDIRDTMIDGIKYISMLAWKSEGFINNKIKAGSNGLKYYASENSLFSDALFVTVTSDVKNWYKDNNANQLNEDQINMRLKQLLGLPPNSTNSNFVEFWTKSEDIYRPTLDSSLKRSCRLLNLSASYIKAFAEFSSRSFESDNILKQYPFTGLGYTWDWNPDNELHKGLSEFVLKENRKVFIRRILNTKDFFTQTD